MLLESLIISHLDSDDLQFCRSLHFDGPEPRDDSRPSNEPTDVAQGSKMNRTRCYELKTVHTGTITAYFPTSTYMLCVSVTECDHVTEFSTFWHGSMIVTTGPKVKSEITVR